MARQVSDNGEDGVYFSPRSRHDPPAPRGVEVNLSWIARLARPLTELGWYRLWIATHIDSGGLIGHIDLSGGRISSELHRAELGMGIERAHRGCGLGAVLLDTAIAWARDEAKLSWIELGVFHCNARAQRLYKSRGFGVIGTIEDRFRVDGVVIDDVRMALRLA